MRKFLSSERVKAAAILAVLIPLCAVFVTALVSRAGEDSAIGQILDLPRVDAAAYVEQRATRYTGDGDVDIDYSVSGKKLIYDVHFAVAAVPNTGELTVVLNSAAGSQYDRTIVSEDMADDAIREWSAGYHGALPPAGLLMEKGDVLEIDYNNEDAQTYGLTIVTSN